MLPAQAHGAAEPRQGLRDLFLPQVLIDIDGKHEWRDCIDVPGVRLPRGYYFGTSSVTGDLSGTAPGSQTLLPKQLLCSFGGAAGYLLELMEANEDLSML